MYSAQLSYTQIYSQLTGKLVLMLVNISTASSSNHRGLRFLKTRLACFTWCQI